MCCYPGPKSFKQEAGDDVAAQQIVDLMESHLRTLPHGKELKVSKYALPGDPRDVLPQQAVALGADYLVLGTRGQSAIKTMIMGSVAEHCVRHAPVQVIITKNLLKE